MRRQCCLLLLLTAACGLQLAYGGTVEEAWTAFKTSHGRSYASPEEELHRRRVFADNLDVIRRHSAEHDAGRSTYRLGVNQFADMTNGEFRTLLSSQRRPRTQHRGVGAGKISHSVTRPAEFDWRQQGVPVKIKDQGQLGAAWLFAAVDSVGYGYFITTQESVSLSRQNLRDCVPMTSVIDDLLYVKEHGLADETQYPETGGTGPCQTTPVRATVEDVVTVEDGDEDALADALLQNPVAVEIDAGNISFQLYSSGIYADPNCSPTRIDHAVVLVGYGVSDGVDFWSLANSWGSAWGEGGFMRMKRGENMCGVASYAGAPIGVNPA